MKTYEHNQQHHRQNTTSISPDHHYSFGVNTRKPAPTELCVGQMCWCGAHGDGIRLTVSLSSTVSFHCLVPRKFLEVYRKPTGSLLDEPPRFAIFDFLDFLENAEIFI